MVSTLSAGEVLDRLDAEERQAVEEFRDRLRAELGPRLRDLRIFGSKARGDDHGDSDIDLLVLIDGDAGPTADRVRELAASINGLLWPVVYNFDRYHDPVFRASGFYKELRKESVRL